MYPPNIYWPTRMIVIVGPLLSQLVWKVDTAQPSSDARQHRFHWEDTLCATGFNQSLNKNKNFLLLPTIAESDNPSELEWIKKILSNEIVNCNFHWQNTWVLQRMEEFIFGQFPIANSKGIEWEFVTNTVSKNFRVESKSKNRSQNIIINNKTHTCRHGAPSQLCSIQTKALSTLTRVNLKTEKIWKRRVKIWLFDVSVFKKSPFRPFSPYTLHHIADVIKFTQFTLPAIYSAFLESPVFGDRRNRFSVDGWPNWVKKDAFSNLTGSVCTGP